MKIALISDAWHPQINGVVRTLTQTIAQLEASGHEVLRLSPESYRNFPCPGYTSIRLALFPYRQLARALDAFAPDAIHIATEGPLGHAARRYCLKRNYPFTTAYHTRFPEYLAAKIHFPTAISYAYLRRFHAPATRVMVPTKHIVTALEARGFTHLHIWSRGVDTALFHPASRDGLAAFCQDEKEKAQPKYVYIGRISIEKNLDAFLSLPLAGSKWVIGEGPYLNTLKKRYPGVHFLGAYPNSALAPFYNAADVFVFPSKTDTFGLVMLEAMACGTPCAAFPVAGPLDVIKQTVSGIYDADLAYACRKALTLPREDVAAYASAFTWEATSERFFSLLAPFTR